MPTAEIEGLLALMGRLGGSDLHLKADAVPRIRVDGVLTSIDEVGVLSAADTDAILDVILPTRLRAYFEQHREVDFAFSGEAVGRFRANAFMQRGSTAIVMRRIPEAPGSPRDLGLPEVVSRLAEETRGLVLVTGPTGAGKTTTLASMMAHINATRSCHIITIEDPIEYLHEDQVASVEQREVGSDTESFDSAMRVALRQDPDVIMVGEIRDRDTAEAALRAAETGHLVVSTLHTINATETINRLVDFFPFEQQAQVRLTLAGTLRGTVSQRLIRRADDKGRVAALEVMVVNGRISQCIADPELTSEIESIVADGDYYGMLTFDQSLMALIESGDITIEEGFASATKPHDLRLGLERRGLAATLS